MRRFLTHLVATAVALSAAAWILPGVTIVSVPALLVAAMVLGFVNAIVRPLLVLLTLPLTVFSLGLFYLLLNGTLFAISAWVVPGFRVSSLAWAIAGAIVFGALNLGISRLEKEK